MTANCFMQIARCSCSPRNISTVGNLIQKEVFRKPVATTTLDLIKWGCFALVLEALNKEIILQNIREVS